MGSPSNNDNVRFNRNYNINDNVKSNKTENQVNAIADRIKQKLNADDDSINFYYKVAWKLSESMINDNLETALKGNNPQRYFTWLCKRYL